MELLPLRSVHVKNIAVTLGEGLSHADINEIFEDLSIPDIAGIGRSRVDRIALALKAEQSSTRSSGIVAKFIEETMIPARYTGRPLEYRQLRTRLNGDLAFLGWSVTERGKLIVIERAETLGEAAALGHRVMAELHQRRTHAEVLKYCTQEFLVEDIFHGLHEATKSISERLRLMTGIAGDGAALFRACLAGTEPVIRINALENETDRSEQNGFLNLLVGLHGMWRNSTAHEVRLNSSLKESEVINALSTITYVHDRLDASTVRTST